MYLGERELGEPLTFYAQAQDTGGSAVNGAPDTLDYDVYAGENPVAVATGTMTHLDAAALGNYSETITLSAPTFAEDTWYEIRMYPTGTIDGETPAAIHTFKIVDRSAWVREAVWKRLQPAAPDADAMEDIKTDTDNLEFTGHEG